MRRQDGRKRFTIRLEPILATRSLMKAKERGETFNEMISALLVMATRTLDVDFK